MSLLRTGLISGMEVILRYKELCSNCLLYLSVIFTISHRCCSFSSYLWPLCIVIVLLGSQLHEISSNTARNSLKHSFNFAKKKHMHLHNSKSLFKNYGITPKSIVLHSLLMWVSPILGCKEPAAKLVPHKKFTCSRREKGWDSWWTLLLVSRYSTDYGMFRFCVAHTELDWREGSEQYKFIENCLASVDRQRQPWLIFLAHRVLGYSSVDFYVQEGSFEEPMGREDLQNLWQRYKVDIALYGHVHNYERSCPVYEVWSCITKLYHSHFFLHFALHWFGTTTDIAIS